MRSLPLLLLVTACGSSGPSDGLPAGTYKVTATITNQPVEWRFSVVSATDDQVVMDWTAGDVRGTFPIRATATFSDGTYRVQWNGQPFGVNYWLRFSGVGSCEGMRFEPFVPLTDCQVARP